MTPKKIKKVLKLISVGLSTTMLTYIVISIKISMVSTIIALKEKGTIEERVKNDEMLKPYIDILIQYTSIPWHLIIILITTIYISIKWNNITKTDKIILSLSALISVSLIHNHFDIPTSIPLSIYLLLAYIMCHVGGILAPYYKQWQKRNHTNKLLKLLNQYNLTNREKDIVVELLEGKRNKAIGNKLFIEEGTVKQHLKIIFKKIQIKSRTELISKINNKKTKKYI